MEFPKIGKQCAVESCKQNDYLPISCVHCSGTFCKHHFHVFAHGCEKFDHNAVVLPGNKTEYYVCSNESCSHQSPVEMICLECRKHFCLTHRHHGCSEISDDELERRKIKWEKSRETFSVAKNTVENIVTENLKKSKKVEMANKVQLMRLKGRAVGSKEIPIVNRRYFLTYRPLSSPKKESQAVFVCNQWSVGRTVDSIAALLGVRNTNNVANSEKLRLFHQSNGDVIANKMEIVLSELFDNNCLIDGENLILEYSNTDKIDSSLYK